MWVSSCVHTQATQSHTWTQHPTGVMSRSMMDTWQNKQKQDVLLQMMVFSTKWCAVSSAPLTCMHTREHNDRHIHAQHPWGDSDFAWLLNESPFLWTLPLVVCHHHNKHWPLSKKGTMPYTVIKESRRQRQTLTVRKMSLIGLLWWQQCYSGLYLLWTLLEQDNSKHVIPCKWQKQSLGQFVTSKQAPIYACGMNSFQSARMKQWDSSSFVNKKKNMSNVYTLWRYSVLQQTDGWSKGQTDNALITQYKKACCVKLLFDQGLVWFQVCSFPRLD